MAHFQTYSLDTSSVADSTNHLYPRLRPSLQHPRPSPPSHDPPSLDAPRLPTNGPHSFHKLTTSTLSQIHTYSSLHALLTNPQTSSSLTTPPHLLERLANLHHALDSLRTSLTQQLDASLSAQEAHFQSPYEIPYGHSGEDVQELTTILEVLHEAEELGVEGWRCWAEEGMRMRRRRVGAWVEQQTAVKEKGMGKGLEQAAGLQMLNEEYERKIGEAGKDARLGTASMVVNDGFGEEGDGLAGGCKALAETRKSIEEQRRRVLEHEREVLLHEKRVLEHERSLLERERRIGNAGGEDYFSNAHIGTQVTRSPVTTNGDGKNKRDAFADSQPDNGGQIGLGISTESSETTPKTIRVPSPPKDTSNLSGRSDSPNLPVENGNEDITADDYTLLQFPHKPNRRSSAVEDHDWSPAESRHSKSTSSLASSNDSRSSRLPPFKFYIENRGDVPQHVLYPLPAGFQIPSHAADVVGIKFPTGACIIHFNQSVGLIELKKALDFHQAAGHRAITIGPRTSTRVIEAHRIPLLEERIYDALAKAVDNRVWEPEPPKASLTFAWGEEGEHAIFIVSKPDMEFIRPSDADATIIYIPIQYLDFPPNLGTKFSSKDHYLSGGFEGNDEPEEQGWERHDEFEGPAHGRLFGPPLPSFPDRFYALAGRGGFGHMESPYLPSSGDTSSLDTSERWSSHREDTFKPQTLYPPSHNFDRSGTPAGFDDVSLQPSDDAPTDAAPPSADITTAWMERAKYFAEQFHAFEERYTHQDAENETLKRKLAGQNAIMDGVRKKAASSEQKAQHFQNSILGLVRQILTTYDEVKEVGITDQLNDIFQALQGGRRRRLVTFKPPRPLQEPIVRLCRHNSPSQTRNTQQSSVNLRGGGSRSTASGSTVKHWEQETEDPPVLGFIWDVSRSTAILNSHQHFTFSPGTSLQSIRYMLHYRKVNNKGDNPIFKYMLDVLEAREEGDIPLPAMPKNTVLLITVPRQLGGLASNDSEFAGELPEWDTNWEPESDDDAEKTELYRTFHMLQEEVRNCPEEDECSSYMSDVESAIEDLPSPGNSFVVSNRYSQASSFEPEVYLQIRLEKPDSMYLSEEQAKLQQRLSIASSRNYHSNTRWSKVSTSPAESDESLVASRRRHKDLREALGTPYFQMDTDREPIVEPGLIPVPYNSPTLWDDSTDRLKQPLSSHVPHNFPSSRGDGRPTPPPSLFLQEGEVRQSNKRGNGNENHASSERKKLFAVRDARPQRRGLHADRSPNTLLGDTELWKESKQSVPNPTMPRGMPMDETWAKGQVANLQPVQVTPARFSERNPMRYLARSGFLASCPDPTQISTYADPLIYGPTTLRRVPKSASLRDRDSHKSRERQRRWSSGGGIPVYGQIDDKSDDLPPARKATYKDRPKKDLNCEHGVTASVSRASVGQDRTSENNQRYVSTLNKSQDTRSQMRNEGEPTRSQMSGQRTQNGKFVPTYQPSGFPHQVSGNTGTNNGETQAPPKIVMSEKARGKLPVSNIYSHKETEPYIDRGEWDGTTLSLDKPSFVEPVQGRRNGIQLRM